MTVSKRIALAVLSAAALMTILRRQYRDRGDARDPA